jgi:1-aminocyclopropane-1-carboxylate deaminase/D-cysteine desulfhydrase-like pyridoxal-dependent ACC family enzyme
MPQRDFLSERFPRLGEALPKIELASLPTPVSRIETDTARGKHNISVKYDNLTGSIYGGNKVRKLEYIFARARDRKCATIATFGAVGSNHALATALYAKQVGFDCTCFLSHQAKTPLASATLNRHLQNDTNLVRYGGTYAHRLRILRENLWDRNAWIIPMGGSSWLGTVGFVAAGLELAAQIKGGEIPQPDSLYVGSGTMGTAVGIALGLAIAGLETDIQAIRVSDTSITNERALNRLLNKTVAMMHDLDPTVPAELARQTRITIRDEFFGPGYAQSTAETRKAIKFAGYELDLALEPTYTGKTMAALLADLETATEAGRNILYWHTYNSVPLDVPADRPLIEDALPEEFLRYFQTPAG